MVGAKSRPAVQATRNQFINEDREDLVRRKLITISTAILTVPLASLTYLASPAAAQATGNAPDNAPQTLGSAALYGTSTPLGVTAAGTHSARVRALARTLRHHDSRVHQPFVHHASRPSRAGAVRAAL